MGSRQPCSLFLIISPVATLLLYIRHCRRLTEANCLKCSFRLMVSYSVDRKLHRQEEFCRTMLLRCNASCVPQRCGLNVSHEMNEIVQEFNVVTEQSKILGIFDILEAAANATYETVENLTSIPFQSKIPMARPGYSRGSRHGRIECTRISWSGATRGCSFLVGGIRSSDDILWALHAIFSPLSCYRNGCLDRLH